MEKFQFVLDAYETLQDAIDDFVRKLHLDAQKVKTVDDLQRALIQYPKDVVIEVRQSQTVPEELLQILGMMKEVQKQSHHIYWIAGIG